MERYRYALSAAFYRDLARGQSVVFVFVQTREPYEVAVLDLDKAQLLAGWEQWQTALARFDRCWQANEWPEAEPDTPDDDPLMFNIPTTRRFELPVVELDLMIFKNLIRYPEGVILPPSG